MQRNLDSIESNSLVNVAEYAQELASLGYVCGVPIVDPWHPLSNVGDVSEAVERAYRAVAGGSFAAHVDIGIRPDRYWRRAGDKPSKRPRGAVAEEAYILGISPQTWRAYRGKTCATCGAATFAAMVSGLAGYARLNTDFMRASWADFTRAAWETRRAVAAAMIGADPARAFLSPSSDDNRYSVELLGISRQLSDESNRALVRVARALFADERMFGEAPKR